MDPYDPSPSPAAQPSGPGAAPDRPADPVGSGATPADDRSAEPAAADQPSPVDGAAAPPAPGAADGVAEPVPAPVPPPSASGEPVAAASAVPPAAPVPAAEPVAAESVAEPASSVPVPADPPVEPVAAQPVVAPSTAEPLAAAPAPEPVPAEPVPAETASADADPEDSAAAAPAQRSERSVGRLVRNGALAVLVLALLVGAALLARQLQTERAAERARTEALPAARDAARVLFSYDHTTLDADFARGLAVTTGKFREEYTRTTSEVVREVALQYDAVVKAEVSEAGVIRASADEVVVLVFLNQSTTSTRVEGQKIDQSRVRMRLVERGGDWRVAEVTAL